LRQYAFATDVDADTLYFRHTLDVYDLFSSLQRRAALSPLIFFATLCRFAAAAALILSLRHCPCRRRPDAAVIRSIYALPPLDAARRWRAITLIR